MADQIQAQDGQTPDEPQAAPQAGATTDPGAKPKWDEETTAYIKQLRDEAAGYRVENKKYRDAEKKAQEDKLLADNNLKELLTQKEREVQEIMLQARNANLKAEVATRANALNVKSVNSLLTLVKDGVEYDAEGNPQNLDALIEAVLREVPGLVVKPAGGTGGNMTNTQRQNGVPPHDPKKMKLGTPGIWDTLPQPKR